MSPSNCLYRPDLWNWLVLAPSTQRLVFNNIDKNLKENIGKHFRLPVKTFICKTWCCFKIHVKLCDQHSTALVTVDLWRYEFLTRVISKSIFLPEPMIWRLCDILYWLLNILCITSHSYDGICLKDKQQFSRNPTLGW